MTAMSPSRFARLVQIEVLSIAVRLLHHLGHALRRVGADGLATSVMGACYRLLRHENRLLYDDLESYGGDVARRARLARLEYDRTCTWVDDQLTQIRGETDHARPSRPS